MRSSMLSLGFGNTRLARAYSSLCSWILSFTRVIWRVWDVAEEARSCETTMVMDWIARSIVARVAFGSGDPS